MVQALGSGVSQIRMQLALEIVGNKAGTVCGRRHAKGVAQSKELAIFYLAKLWVI